MLEENEPIDLHEYIHKTETIPNEAFTLNNYTKQKCIIYKENDNHKFFSVIAKLDGSNNLLISYSKDNSILSLDVSTIKQYALKNDKKRSRLIRLCFPNNQHGLLEINNFINNLKTIKQIIEKGIDVNG